MAPLTLRTLSCLSLLLCGTVAAQEKYWGGEPRLPSPNTEPNLLFARADLPALRAKRSVSPTREWYDRIKNLASGSTPCAAKHSAFLYLMEGDETYLSRARSILLGYRDDPAEKGYNRGFFLSELALTFDMVESALSATDRSAIRLVLANAVAGVLDYIDPDGEGWWYVDYDNYLVGACTGPAMVALVMPDDERALGWLGTSLYYWREALRRGIRGGSYFEGSWYSQLTRSFIISFIYAYNRATGINLHSASVDGVSYADWESWEIKLRLPNGCVTNVDESWVRDARSDSISLARLSAEPETQYWHFFSGTQPGSYTFKRTLLLAFIAYDASIKPREPRWNPTQFIEEDAQAVLRRDWSESSSMLYLGGELQPSGSHGHCDQTEFQIYAHKVYLAICPGYGEGSEGADRYSWFKSPVSHNLILVDGKGPYDKRSYNTTYARTSSCFATSFADGADVAASYEGASVHRSVLYPKSLGAAPENEYFVVIDQVDASATHDYDWQAHIRGTLTVQNSRQAVWRIANADNQQVEMKVFIAWPDAVTLTAHDGSFTPTNELRETVRYIRARARGVDVRYVALLYPRTVGNMADPSIESVAGSQARGARLRLVQNGVTVNDVVFVQAPGAADTVDAVRSDGDIAFARTVGGSLKYFIMKEGSYLEFEGSPVLEAEVPLRVAALHYNDSNQVVEGKVALAAGGRIVVYARGSPLSVARTLPAGEHSLVIPYADLGQNATQGRRTIWIEAEAGTLGFPFAPLSDAEASGKACVAVPWSEQGSGTYGFAVQGAGQYYFWARIVAPPGGASNSFYVSVDGSPADVWDTQESSVWAWDRVRLRGNGTMEAPAVDPLVLDLAVGPHVVELRGREKNMRIDRLLITDDPNYVPSGLGTGGAPPGLVLDLAGTYQENAIMLAWRAPQDSDFAGVVIRCQIDGECPGGVGEGFLVADVAGTPDGLGTYTHTGIRIDAAYSYSVFAYDAEGNFSGPSCVEVKPAATQTIDKPDGLRLGW